jgi:hypothetical protein
MKVTIHGTTFNTEEVEQIATDASPVGDDCLYRTPEGQFFPVLMSTFVDSIRLGPSECPEDREPELDYTQSWGNATRHVMKQCRARIRCTKRIVPVTDRQTLVWCVKTQIPECFRGCILESI